MTHETEPSTCPSVEQALVADAAICRRQKPDPLVVAHGTDRDSGLAGQLAHGELPAHDSSPIDP